MPRFAALTAIAAALGLGCAPRGIVRSAPGLTRVGARAPAASVAAPVPVVAPAAQTAPAPTETPAAPLTLAAKLPTPPECPENIAALSSDKPSRKELRSASEALIACWVAALNARDAASLARVYSDAPQYFWDTANATTLIQQQLEQLERVHATYTARNTSVRIDQFEQVDVVVSLASSTGETHTLEQVSRFWGPCAELFATLPCADATMIDARALCVAPGRGPARARRLHDRYPVELG